MPIKPISKAELRSLAEKATDVRVTVVPIGVRATTDKEIYNSARSEQHAIDERRFVIGSDGREHCHNGLGEWIY